MRWIPYLQFSMDVPVVWQPDETSDTESHSELAADVVVVERLVEPISISEEHTSH